MGPFSFMAGRAAERERERVAAEAEVQRLAGERAAAQPAAVPGAPEDRAGAIYQRQKEYYQTYLDRAAADPARRDFHLRQAESVNPDTSQPLMQERALAGQEQASDEYSAKVPDTINREVGQVRSQLAGQLAQGRRSLKSAENSRGMLFSGRRISGEGEMAAEAGGKLAQARGDTIRKVLGQEQDLAYKPIATRAGLSAGEAEQRGLLQGVQSRLKDQRAGYLQGGMGAIGEGIGRLVGKSPSSTTVQTNAPGPGGPGAYPVKGW